MAGRFLLAITATAALSFAAQPNRQPIAAVRDAAAKGGRPLVQVNGVVTVSTGTLVSAPYDFYVQDGSGGISVAWDGPGELAPGDQVTVEGLAAWHADSEIEIKARKVQKTGSGREPEPRSLSLREARSARFGGQLVRVRGEVTGMVIGDTRDVMTLGPPDDELRVYIRRRIGTAPALRNLHLGAFVEVTGISLPLHANEHQVRFRRIEDITVLRDGPLWDWRRVGAILAGGGLLVSAVWGWIALLQRRIRQKTAEIQELLNQARESSRLKSEFLANMSHEVRTPMNGILGMTQLVLDTPLSETQRENLLLVRSSARSLLTVINDILDFSKIEAGKLELSEVDFRLADSVRSAVQFFSWKAAERGIALRCTVSDEVPEWVRGDPHRLRQVLVNLVGNALKFTEAGSVSVHVSVEAGGCRHLRFEVTDTGIGIPQHKLQLIFDPFRQADGSVTRHYGGTGLGLSVCRQLVTLMDGEIGVESEPGRGSRFIFTARLPFVAKGAAPEESSTGRLNMTLVQPLRILLAEDNKVNRILARRILEGRGHRVVQAANGLEAIQQWRDSSPDLILMDLQMPEMDGLEATRRIREAEGEGVHIPIIALTANAMVHDRQVCQDAGMDAYLSKPFTAEELVREVELRGHRAVAA